jgi:hypothetical protein
MMPGPAIAAICAAIVILSLWLASEVKLRRIGFRRLARSARPSPSHIFDPARSSSFRGGARVGNANASSRLGRLTIDDEWALLHVPGGLLTVWISRRDVELVRSVRFTLAHAVRFETSTGAYDNVVFWTRSSRDVMAAFKEFGWNAER